MSKDQDWLPQKTIIELALEDLHVQTIRHLCLHEVLIPETIRPLPYHKAKVFNKHRIHYNWEDYESKL